MTNTSSGSACATRRRAKCRSSRSAGARRTTRARLQIRRRRATLDRPLVVGESESPDDDREDATEVTSARKLRPQARRSPETVADAHIAALRESDAATAALYFRTAAGAEGLAAAVEAGRLAPLMDPDARLVVLRSAQLSGVAHARVFRATTRATGKEGAAFVVVLGRDANGAWGVDATAPVPAADLRRWKPPAEA